ncbi:MAG: transposase, partial [Deltaproteobacteria bacterium]|nr:transposase [Deltaproteobacteria bacterium]
MVSKENLEALARGDGERRRRYVICYNPQEAERQRHHRKKILDELRQELPRLRGESDDDETHSKHICQLRSS